MSRIRSNVEIAIYLQRLYSETFGGKSEQRFIISWDDVCYLYQSYEDPFSVLHGLKKTAADRGLHISDFYMDGELYIAVLPFQTVKRWRRASRKLLKEMERKHG